MDETLGFDTLLVPTDFSDMSHEAFERALKLARGDDANVILLHVIDPAYIDFAERHGFVDKSDAMKQVRARAESEMDEFVSGFDPPVKVTKMICEGTPFLQIIDHARDLLVDAVIIGRVGSRGPLERLLFGSTAEKVIRGCSRPVIVLPVEDE